MNTEIERHTTPTVPAREWGLMTQQAAALAESDIIPTAYRRKPANILVAALTGRSHGWDAMTSMNQGHVIEGKWAMRPEAMLGLVRRAGHSVSGDVAAEGATVTGKRADTGDTMAFTFTIADAVQANLCKLKDGKPFARSNSGKVLPWEQYPAMMCYWRAVGTVCRFLFSDVTLGAYSAEELGAELDADGNVVDAGEVVHTPAEPQPLSDEAKARFLSACEDHDIDHDEVLVRAFPEGTPDPLLDSHLPAMRDVFKAMVVEAAEADIVEAEIVDDGDIVTETLNELVDEIVEAEVVDPAPLATTASRHPEGDLYDALDTETEPVDGWVSAETGEAPAPRDDGSMRPSTRHQVGKIKGEYKRLEVDDRTEQLATTAEVVGHPIVTHNDLTWIEASKVIEFLLKSETPPEQMELVPE